MLQVPKTGVPVAPKEEYSRPRCTIITLRCFRRYFTWDPVKFATPGDMVANLTAKGRRMVVIIDPHIKREVGYFVHDEATDNGYYVKDKDGKDYEGD